MTVDRHMSWADLEQFVNAGDPSAHAIPGEPPLEVVVGAGGNHLGLRIPVDTAGELPVSPLAEIKYRKVSVAGTHQYEIRTESRELFSYFYDFLCAVADHIQVDGLAAAEAFSRALQNWQALLRRAAGLTEEQQIGLLGELWVLRALIARVGGAALEAWTGPAGQAHDFRIGAVEIEVKTTRGEKRIHKISSLQQLVASPGAELVLLSIQVTPAGADAGTSLARELRAARTELDSEGRGNDFAALIERAFHLPWIEIEEYRTPMKLRSKPEVCEVHNRFPRLTRHDIDGLAYDEVHRVMDASYLLDVDGLGVDALEWLQQRGGGR